MPKFEWKRSRCSPSMSSRVCATIVSENCPTWGEGEGAGEGEGEEA